MNEQAVFDALRYRVEVDMRGTRWYYNAANQLHREGGPAIVWDDGDEWWYINGVILTEAEFNQAVKVLGE